MLHAPRQTGNTTAMRTLAQELRARGVAACWASQERSQGVEDIERAEPIWLQALHEW